MEEVRDELEFVGLPLRVDVGDEGAICSVSVAAVPRTEVAEADRSKLALRVSFASSRSEGLQNVFRNDELADDNNGIAESL